MALRFHPEVVFDLDLVAAAEVDAAVALLDHLEFDMQLEVGELLLGDNVSPVRRVFHNRVDYSPRIGLALVSDSPARQIAPVEQSYRFFPSRSAFVVELGRAYCDPLQSSAVRIEGCPFQAPASQIS